MNTTHSNRNITVMRDNEVNIELITYPQFCETIVLKEIPEVNLAETSAD
jgi:hypothetical protein